MKTIPTTKLKKIAPWNWFKSEDEEERHQNNASGHHGQYPLDTRHADHPLARMHQEMDRLFDDFFPAQWPVSSQRWWKFGDGENALFKPQVDISESRNKYTVKVEVPGVEKENIKVDVRDHSLVISGEKKHENDEEDEHYHKVERYYGSFQRVLNLPPDADTSDVDAKFHNGVLTLKVKRNHEKKADSHAIEIK